MLLPNISLYIHIPWCINKCTFCDLYTIKNSFIKHEIYIEKLLLDLNENLIFLKNRKIYSIYIGGGTPSLLSIKNILNLFKKLSNIIDFSFVKEITIETNPYDLNKEKILIYKQIGITRISIGIQTFNKNIIHKINRKNNNLKLILLIDYLNKINFKNYNLDIIYGLPHQNFNLAIKDLKLAISLNPKHISWYQLINKNKPNILNDNNIIELYIYGNKILKKNNYFNYEVSSYCKYNYICTHNINYWNFGDYIGIGLNASSKISISKKKIIRIHKHHALNIYLKNNFIKNLYFLSRKDIILEYFLNRLRLYSPLKVEELYLFSPKELKIINKKLYILEKKKYFKKIYNNWILTMLGKLYLNNIINYFNFI